MVKAVKRREDDSVEIKGKGMTKREKNQRLSKYVILITMALIAIGFIFPNVPDFSNRPEEPAPVDDGTIIKSGVLTGTKTANPGEALPYSAVYGRLQIPTELERITDGELYYLDGGVNQLIISNVTVGELDSSTRGDYIMYEPFDCGDFVCMLPADRQENQTISTFDSYDLSLSSKYLDSSTIAFPSLEAGAVSI